MENRANEFIEKAIEDLMMGHTGEKVLEVLESIRISMKGGGQLLVPVDDEKQNMRILQLTNGKDGAVAFTSEEEIAKGEATANIAEEVEHLLQMVMQREELEGLLINPWGNSFFLDKGMLAKILEAGQNSLFQSHIYLERGDITEIECACIVNAANETLLGGGGVDGAIHKAAGPKLLETCKTLDGCRVGEAKITRGYELKAPYVIHTVGPRYEGTEENVRLLSSCYWSALMLAKNNNLHTIAFPAISTGAYGYPPEEAAIIAMNTVCHWLEENKDYGMIVIFSCFDDDTYEIYQKLAGQE